MQRWRRRGFSSERWLQRTKSFAALPEPEMAAMSLLLRTVARAGLRQPLSLSAGLGQTTLLGLSASRSGVIDLLTLIRLFKPRTVLCETHCVTKRILQEFLSCGTELVSLRHASEGKKMLFIRATRFYDNRFLRLLNWYVMLTGIPVLMIITFVNIYIGQAELAEIPEGYIPEHWEYYKHPISRWISRYFYSPPEKEYEKGMAKLHIEFEKRKLRKLEAEAKHLMYEKGDGPWHQHEAPGTSTVDYAPKANPDF